jgi:integrase
LDRVPAVDLPRLELPPPCIHSPEEAGRLLAAAAAEDLSVCRFLALGYFAGLRPAEIARLREDNLARDWIEVPAVAAKTRTRRIVTANETLQAWLALGGSLPVRNLVRRLDRVREAAGVPWGHDVVRHTFASYHLAQHQSADRTAFELGHGSTQMLFRHYREAVTPEAAARFWALRPGITTAAGRTPP